uniref:uncharacterized protein LOC109961194 n=1 Tax=Monopterus albus TaxID=43700 RepID=UPI0009B31A5A|nr:uncharacterized protein LOC109961194 [Monopterus albus]
MFRFSLIVCVSLMCGITAKPYKPWNKLPDEAFQDTIMSLDGKEKIPWGVEVEPPEDKDETQYDIDPSVTGSGLNKQPLKTEEDLDKLHHASVADLLKVQIPNLDALHAADIQAESSEEDANMKYSQKPEEDKDDINHSVFSQVASEEPEQDWDEVYHRSREELDAYLVPLVAEYKSHAEIHVAYSEPEKDEDGLYHHDDQRSPVQMGLQRNEVSGGRKVRVHLQPEEDMDDLYHKDFLQPIPYQLDAKAAAPVNLPSQWKYSQPEEDMDHLYHQ